MILLVFSFSFSFASETFIQEFHFVAIITTFYCFYDYSFLLYFSCFFFLHRHVHSTTTPYANPNVPYTHTIHTSGLLSLLMSLLLLLSLSLLHSSRPLAD